jgi:type III secretion protein T
MDQLIFATSPETATFFLKQLDLLLYTSLLLAGPFLGIMILIDISTGLVGRFLPQLNVFLIAMPIKSGITFLMLALYIGFLADYMKTSFFTIGQNLPGLAGLLR